MKNKIVDLEKVKLIKFINSKLREAKNLYSEDYEAGLEEAYLNMLDFLQNGEENE